MYIAKDTLALKLDKSKAWPTLKQLVEYGQQHCLVDRPLEDIERISAAVMDYRPTEQTTISRTMRAEFESAVAITIPGVAFPSVLR